jgi:hypothetical protein
MDTPASTPPRARAWAACRAVCLIYAAVGAPLALVLLGALPAATLLARKLGGRRARIDPWWPITRWAAYVATLPRLAAWLERRYC